ncbi:MAG: hypothetical protein IJ516_05755 [Phascolarctobacterium sp.]|nr:hypothetical protein [Phascolarctobacterium sp.]
MDYKVYEISIGLLTVWVSFLAFLYSLLFKFWNKVEDYIAVRSLFLSILYSYHCFVISQDNSWDKTSWDNHKKDFFLWFPKQAMQFSMLLNVSTDLPVNRLLISCTLRKLSKRAESKLSLKRLLLPFLR